MFVSRSPPRAATIRHHTANVRILVRATKTGGTMGMVETINAPGTGPAYHRHSREDETFYIVSGPAEIRIGDETFVCKAGDHIFGPRNVFHTFRNVGETPLTVILVYTPGGFEQSFLDVVNMLENGKDQNDVKRMLSDRYGMKRWQSCSQ